MLDHEVAGEDLRQIERSIQICRRIFGGMLGFARTTARNPSEVYLPYEIDSKVGQGTTVRVSFSLPEEPET